jgi:uncharacterized protein (DUF427 family)
MPTGHIITITPKAARVEVRVDGTLVAQSDRATVLGETGLPPRYYLPRDDVRTELLHPTNHTSTCPFKGEASYWSLTIGDTVHENLVWSYERPIPDADEIAGLLCFYSERVDLVAEDAAVS